jgi:aspartate kinase
LGVIVQKYGGTSVGSIDRIRNVAKKIAKTYEQGHKVAVVVSAMGGTTDQLVSMAHEITEKPDKRELDVLLSTGEQITIALLTMCLHSMGYKAKSLLGHQAEVKTDSQAGRKHCCNRRISGN